MRMVPCRLLDRRLRERSAGRPQALRVASRNEGRRDERIKIPYSIAFKCRCLNHYCFSARSNNTLQFIMHFVDIVTFASHLSEGK